MGLVLTYITLAVVLIVVIALVFYLVRIILALRGAARNLGQLAEGLEAVKSNTDPLPDKLATINGALSQLLTGLLAVDGHLAAVARLLRR